MGWMRRIIDKDAPTTEWRRRDQVRTETPLGGIEVLALRAPNSAAWDAQTFAVRLPSPPEGPSRAVAMGIAALLSFVIGLGTFLAVMRLQEHAAVTAAPPRAGSMSLAAAPLVEEGVPVPSPTYAATSVGSTLDSRFVPTEDVVPPPEPRAPSVAGASAASLIVPTTSAPHALHPAPAPTVRKGKKAR